MTAFGVTNFAIKTKYTRLDFSSNAEVLRISQVSKQDKYSELLLVATDLKPF